MRNIAMIESLHWMSTEDQYSNQAIVWHFHALMKHLIKDFCVSPP